VGLAMMGSRTQRGERGIAGVKRPSRERKGSLGMGKLLVRSERGHSSVWEREISTSVSGSEESQDREGGGLFGGAAMS